MKTFAGNKTLDEILAQCKANGLTVDMAQFQVGGDHIIISSTDGEATTEVFFNTFNGRFFGTTPDGTEFSSDDVRDGTPWFDALLEFFYRDETV